MLSAAAVKQLSAAVLLLAEKQVLSHALRMSQEPGHLEAMEASMEAVESSTEAFMNFNGKHK